MFVYDYEISLEPNKVDFNSRNTRPVTFMARINGAENRAVAVKRFMAEQFPVARRNGIVRGAKQAHAMMNVRRINSIKVEA